MEYIFALITLIIIGIAIYMLIKENREKTSTDIPTPQQSSLPETSTEPHLINCPACGANVSNQAPICPHCGHPFTPPQSKMESEQSADTHNYPDPYAKKAYEEIKRKETIEMIASAISIIMTIGFFIFCMNQCTSCIDETSSAMSTLYKTAKQTPTYQRPPTNTYNYSSQNSPAIEHKPLNSEELYTDYDVIPLKSNAYILWAPSFFKPEYAGNNIYCHSADGAMSLSVFEEPNSDDTSAKEMYTTILSMEKEDGNNLTYNVCYSDRFYVSGFRPDSSAFYRHSLFRANTIYTYIFEWQKNVYKYGVDILNDKIIRFEFENDKTAKNQ